MPQKNDDPRAWKKDDEIDVGQARFKLTGEALYKQFISGDGEEQYRTAWNATLCAGQGPSYVVLAVNMELWLSIDELKAVQEDDKAPQYQEGTIIPHEYRRERQAVLEKVYRTLAIWKSHYWTNINKYNIVEKVFVSIYNTASLGPFESFKSVSIWLNLGEAGVTIPQDQPALHRLEKGLHTLHMAGYAYTGSYEVFVFKKGSDDQEGCYLLEMNEVKEIKRRTADNPFDKEWAFFMCRVPRRLAD